MRAITINVSDPVYREFQEHARKNDRTVSELIREAMEEYRTRKMRPRTSLRDLRASSVGAVLAPLGRDDDLMGEMLDDERS